MANVYPLGDTTVTVVTADDDPYDEATETSQSSLDGGNVEVTFGRPKKNQDSTAFDANLAELLDDAELSAIAERLLRGIDMDLQSRQAWLENMQNGISLLGLEIKNPKGAATSGASPQEGVSTIDHPLVLEASLRHHANAYGELLPADGPVKVRNDGEGGELADALALALEKDLNHYLTKTAKEYYPDTDRMLLMQGFSGIGFKKGFHDPIKRRPVIASINAEDLIVSNASTDLDGANRVTHRIMMRHSLMRRMQLVGAYRDIDLPQTLAQPQKDAVKTKIDQVQGIAAPTYTEPEDQDRELYECYCEIEVPGFEHTLDGEQTGLPLPYKVTIDKEARRILEIRRNWDKDDPFAMPKTRIVAYVFVPGLGFYGIGLLNILGNATKAATAAWRLLIDAGMFANFPGFLYLKSLGRQLTNQFRVPPGGGMPIDAAGGDIRTATMPLPYKDPSAVFIQLIENIVQTAQRVGGTAELQIGEGRQDAPVGTTLALLEQAVKLMSAVHKRLHRAQAAEFGMLKDLLMEDPEALWRHNKKSQVLKILTAAAGQEPVVQQEEAAEARHRAMFLAALSDCELVPAADPNTASQTERYLKGAAMRQMAATNPSIDINAIDKRAFKVMGIDDGDSLFKPVPPPGEQGPTPEEQTAQATLLAAQARLADAQTRARATAAKAQSDMAALASKERIASLGVARELVIHGGDQEAAREELAAESARFAADRAAEDARSAADRANDNTQQRQELAQRQRELTNENAQRHADRMHRIALALAARSNRGVAPNENA